MQAQAQSVNKSVNDSLWDYILSHRSPSLDEVDEIEKAISYQTEPFRSYLNGLLMASQNNFDKAVSFFQKSLESENEFIASNYLAYLGFCAHNLFHREELFRLEERYCTSEHRRVARNIAYSIGNTKLIRKYNLKLLALYDGEKRQHYKEEGEQMISFVENFKKASTLTSAEIQTLCDEAEEIANRHGVNCVGVTYFVNSESDNAYIIRAETNDPHVLAEINTELSYLLCDEKYLNKPFTSWFKSDNNRTSKLK